MLLPMVSIDNLASESCSTCRPAPAGVVDLFLQVITERGGAEDCFWMPPACLPTHVLPPTDTWRGRQPTRLQASMVVGVSTNAPRGEQRPTMGLVFPSPPRQESGMGTASFALKPGGSSQGGQGTGNCDSCLFFCLVTRL